MKITSGQKVMRGHFRVVLSAILLAGFLCSSVGATAPKKIEQSAQIGVIQNIKAAISKIATNNRRTQSTPAASDEITDARVIRRLAMYRAVREELGALGASAFENQAVAVFRDDRQFGGATRLRNDEVYIDAVSFARFAGAADVTWDGETLTAQGGGYDVTVSCSAGYIESSGRCFLLAQNPDIRNQKLFLPIEVTARAFGYGVSRDEGGYSLRLTGSGTPSGGENFYDADALYWLSHIIDAESRGEVMAGKIAVGNVVLNRVADSRFPDTIYSVIFDRSCGVQFSPTANGTIYREPTKESVAAAKMCLEGYTISTQILFFYNPAISKNSWIAQNCDYIETIGNHAFYTR